MDASERACQAISDMIREQVREIDVSTLDGFEDALENAIRDHDFEVDADNVQGLERFVEGVVQDQTSEVEASDVNGLEEFVDERINNVSFEPNKWEERAVEIFNEQIDKRIDSWNETEVELNKRWADKIEEFKPLDATNIQHLVQTALEDPVIKEVIKQEVRRSIVSLLCGLISESIPLAQPVDKKSGS